MTVLSVAQLVACGPVEGETAEEAEERKARERKEVEIDMLEMHHWSVLCVVASLAAACGS